MAFIVPVKAGKFEIRESRSTPKGPRSRTLASFRELDQETIERARKRAEGPPPTVEELTAAALRAGAQVAADPPDRVARNLLSHLAKSEAPSPMLRRLLIDALENPDRSDRPADPEATVSSSARSVSEWLGASLRDRADTLEDLLLLADALPLRRRSSDIGFPRLDSTQP